MINFDECLAKSLRVLERRQSSVVEPCGTDLMIAADRPTTHCTGSFKELNPNTSYA